MFTYEYLLSEKLGTEEGLQLGIKDPASNYVTHFRMWWNVIRPQVALTQGWKPLEAGQLSGPPSLFSLPSPAASYDFAFILHKSELSWEPSRDIFTLEYFGLENSSRLEPTVFPPLELCLQSVSVQGLSCSGPDADSAAPEPGSAPQGLLSPQQLHLRNQNSFKSSF